MLRLALIENLRRVAARVAASLSERELAEHWADRMIDVVEHDPKNLILVVADMARSKPPMTAPFVAELSRRLHGRSTALALPLSWIEQRLAESHQTIEQLVQIEEQHQAAEQVSVSNSIGSLRLLASMDWREFVETLCRVEQTLRDDPADVYARMDFATRDSYRHVVERIAAQQRAARSKSPAPRWSCATRRPRGRSATCARRYYLIERGGRHLERAVGDARAAGAAAAPAVARRPLPWYAGAIVSAILLSTRCRCCRVERLERAAGHVAARRVVGRARGAGAAAAASQLAVALVNWLATLFVRPRALPRMDYSVGIPSASRTLVVVPTMLTSAAAIDDAGRSARGALSRQPRRASPLRAADRLPRRAAGARCRRRALCVDAARARIDALNATIRRAGADGDASSCSTARGAGTRGKASGWATSASAASWPTSTRCCAAASPNASRDRRRHRRAAADVRYVITLDTDTQLPRDAARQMVAHDGASAEPAASSTAGRRGASSTATASCSRASA